MMNEVTYAPVYDTRREYEIDRLLDEMERKGEALPESIPANREAHR